MDKKNIEGAIDQVKGRVKSAAGELAGDQDLKNEGAIDKAKGKLKDAFGTARDTLKKGLDKLDE